MPKLQIDGQLVEVPEGSSLLDAIKTAEGTLPHLCKPDAREPLGACRTCLVEISGSPRLTAACAPVSYTHLTLPTILRV